MRSPCSAAHGSETLCHIAANHARAAELHDAVGGFCHLLRNRMNTLQMSIYLARRNRDGDAGAMWDDLERQYRGVEGVILLFQSVCQPMSLAPIQIGLSLVLDQFEARWRPKFEGRGLALAAELIEEDGPSRLDPSRIAQALDVLAEWRLGRSDLGPSLTLQGGVSHGRSSLEWRESGTPRHDPDGGLPLAALARVASAHGGTMTVDSDHGFAVRIEWPNLEIVPA